MKENDLILLKPYSNSAIEYGENLLGIILDVRRNTVIDVKYTDTGYVDTFIKEEEDIFRWRDRADLKYKLEVL